MSKLTISFTGRNAFTDADVARGIEAAKTVFARHRLSIDQAWTNNMIMMAAKAQADPVWSEADYEACRAMCGGDDTIAAGNATLETSG